MEAIVMYSGGVGSWAAGMRAVEKYGKDHTTLIFCDTKMEDEDLYRFLNEGAEMIGVQITSIADGRTPWEVFYDKRFLGNSRIDPCSKILKRELSKKYLYEHWNPQECIILFGIDNCQKELNRLKILKERYAPYQVDAPLLWDPIFDKDMAKLFALQCGLLLPRLYRLGFQHNNCGGACVKAGQQQWALLLRTMPERYAYHQHKEEELRQWLGKDVSILKDRTNGKTQTLTLARLAEQLGKSQELPLIEEWENCDCM